MSTSSEPSTRSLGNLLKMPGSGGGGQESAGRSSLGIVLLISLSLVCLLAVLALSISLGVIGNGLSNKVSDIEDKLGSLKKRLNDFEAENGTEEQNGEKVQRSTSPQPPSICLEAPDPGPCVVTNRPKAKWFFSPKEEDCRTFEYGGCGGNDNNFASVSRCRSACDVDPALPLPSPPPLPPSSSSSRPNTFSRSSCRLAPDSGPCIQRTPRFYFSGNFSDCLIFSYGGCAGNENNFFSERECRGRCGVGNRPPTTPHPPPPPVRRPDSCLMPADPGLFCNHDEAGGGTVQRFYFDSGSAQCHRFLYAGCGGNENNFSRKEKCDMRCGAATHAGYSFEAN